MADIPFNPQEIMFAVGKELEAELLDAAFIFLVNVAQDTPKDTGRAQGNWRTSQGKTPKFGILKRRGAGASIAAGTRTIKSVGKQLKNSIARGGKGRVPNVFVTNALPYIGRLNAGWSPQADPGYIDEIFNRAIQGSTPRRKRI
jgi:hypothetical protein